MYESDCEEFAYVNSYVSSFSQSCVTLKASRHWLSHVGDALDDLFGLLENHIHKSHTYWVERADSTNRICSATARHERYAQLTFVQSISLGSMKEE